MAAAMYSFIFLLFIFKKDAIASNYKLIKTDFVQLSKEKRRNPNYAYEKSLNTAKKLKIPILITFSFLSLGPLLSTIYDMGKLPINHRSHFIMYWPKVSLTI